MNKMKLAIIQTAFVSDNKRITGGSALMDGVTFILLMRQLCNSQHEKRKEVKSIMNTMVTKIAIGIGIAAIGAAGYAGRKLQKLADKVGMSVKDLSKATEDDIREHSIEAAVRDAANTKVSGYVHRAYNDVCNEAKREIETEARKAVSESKREIEKQVEEEVLRQVENIDINDLKRKVTEKAKDKIVEKFDGSLDDLLKEFSDNLDRMKKIYTSIADTMAPKEASKEISFKVG